MIKLNKKEQAIINYCKPHLDQMWAAYISSIILGVDFREVQSIVKEAEEKRISWEEK